jgi:hypothetical protein
VIATVTAPVLRRVACYRVVAHSGNEARALTAFGGTHPTLLASAISRDNGRVQMDFVPRDRPAFRRAARKAGIKLPPPRIAFMIERTQRPGAVAGVLRTLGTAQVAVSGIDILWKQPGSYFTMVWVDPRQVRKATRLLIRTTGRPRR